MHRNITRCNRNFKNLPDLRVHIDTMNEPECLMTQCLTAFGCNVRQQVEALLPEVPVDRKSAVDTEPAHDLETAAIDQAQAPAA